MKTEAVVGCVCFALCFGVFIAFFLSVRWSLQDQRESCVARGGEPAYSQGAGYVCYAPGTLR